VQASIEQTKRDTRVIEKKLAETRLALGRLDASKKEVEVIKKAKAREPKESKEDEKRNRERCQTHQDTMEVLKGLLGITTVEAPRPDCLRCVYKVQGPLARRKYSEVALLLYFTSSDGGIKSYEVSY
jgi:hypothetical protein